MAYDLKSLRMCLVLAQGSGGLLSAYLFIEGRRKYHHVCLKTLHDFSALMLIRKFSVFIRNITGA